MEKMDLFQTTARGLEFSSQPIQAEQKEMDKGGKEKPLLAPFPTPATESSNKNFSAVLNPQLPLGNVVFQAIRYFLAGNKCTQEYLQVALSLIFQRPVRKKREEEEKKKASFHYPTKTELKVSLIDDWLGKK